MVRFSPRPSAFGAAVPDLDDAQRLVSLVDAVNSVRDKGIAAAYHDRSDGGLWAAICEMAFAGGIGIDIDLAPLVRRSPGGEVAALFAEELGAVLAVPSERATETVAILRDHGLGDLVHVLGATHHQPRVGVSGTAGPLLSMSRCRISRRRGWVSWRISALRDNPECADEEHSALNRLGSSESSGCAAEFRSSARRAAPYLNLGARPKVAILREQGVNNHVETAFAFDAAGSSRHTTST